MKLTMTYLKEFYGLMARNGAMGSKNVYRTAFQNFVNIYFAYLKWCFANKEGKYDKKDTLLYRLKFFKSQKYITDNIHPDILEAIIRDVEEDGKQIKDIIKKEDYDNEEDFLTLLKDAEFNPHQTPLNAVLLDAIETPVQPEVRTVNAVKNMVLSQPVSAARKENLPGATLIIRKEDPTPAVVKTENPYKDIYLKQLKAQERWRKVSLGLLIVAAIIFTPLSLFFTIYLRNRSLLSNQKIVEVEISEQEMAQVKQNKENWKKSTAVAFQIKPKAAEKFRKIKLSPNKYLMDLSQYYRFQFFQKNQPITPQELDVYRQGSRIVVGNLVKEYQAKPNKIRL